MAEAVVVAAASQLDAIRDVAHDAVAPEGIPAAVPLVVWLDGLSKDDMAMLEEALPGHPGSVCVLGAKWDGFEEIPLAAGCRGIISGFGPAGIAAALTLFES